jgi:hypothetical protein
MISLTKIEKENPRIHVAAQKTSKVIEILSKRSNKYHNTWLHIVLQGDSNKDNLIVGIKTDP